jgi:hypothetical protein
MGTEWMFALPTKRIKDIETTIAAFTGVPGSGPIGTEVPLYIFDDSPVNLTERYPVKFPATTSLRQLFYVGAAHKAMVVSLIKERLGSTLASTLVDDIFRPCYGGNRNFTALYSLGKRLLSFDDDMRPFVLQPLRPELPSQTGHRNLVSLGRLYHDASPEFHQVAVDPFTPFFDLLGKRVRDVSPSILRGERLEDSAMDLTTNASLGLAPVNSVSVVGAPPDGDTVIRMAQTYRTGTNDIDAVDFVEMILKDPREEDFLRHHSIYALDFYLPVITDINWRMDCGVAGYDNRAGIPPFMPSPLRFEDFLYRLWIQQPGMCAAHVGAALTHLKSPYMRHSHASEVFNEEMSNLIKRNLVTKGFKASATSVSFEFDGYVTREETDEILEKVNKLAESVKESSKVHGISENRRLGLIGLHATLQDYFFGFEGDMFHLEVSRLIKRESELIKATTTIWPTLLEIALGLLKEGPLPADPLV